LIAQLLVELLEWYLDIKFWFKKRKRRKFEKEHNLPKKLMLYPSQKIGIVIVVVLAIMASLRVMYVASYKGSNTTNERLSKIEQLLEKEKKDIGAYPVELRTIIRNNPLLKDVTKDGWNNKISYKLTKDGTSYSLVSFGKDKTPNTDDDIKLSH
jgi:general secretion pathway protein G